MTKRDREVKEQDLEQLCALFRLLADRTRLNILVRLAQGECNVTSLCEYLSLPQPTVSHHLALLRMHNLVGNRRHGKQVFYTLYGNAEANTLMRFSMQNMIVHIQSKQD